MCFFHSSTSKGKLTGINYGGALCFSVVFIERRAILCGDVAGHGQRCGVVRFTVLFSLDRSVSECSERGHLQGFR